MQSVVVQIQGPASRSGVQAPAFPFEPEDRPEVPARTPAEVPLPGLGSRSTTVDDSVLSERPLAIDPNDILGPAGVGPENHVPASQDLGYQIRFENEAESATAPAQFVRIEQILDADLDARSFRLGNITIGEAVIEVPENRPFFTARLPLGNDGLLADVFAGIDVASRTAFWTFESIDPATGRRPADPLRGLLPPNLAPPAGEGSVRYTIRPTRDATTGTRIDAAASIVFDSNAPIETPPIFHTVDASTPVTQLELVPGGSGEPSLLAWSLAAPDEGAGIAAFEIWLAIDGGEPSLWRTANQAGSSNFQPLEGTRYTFTSVGVDRVGNREARLDASGSRTVELDLTAPVSLAVTSEQTPSPTPALRGTFTGPVASIQVAIAGRTYEAVLGENVWEIPVGVIEHLAPAEYAVDATAVSTTNVRTHASGLLTVIDAVEPVEQSIGRMNRGVVARDAAFGAGHLLYSEEAVADRFGGNLHAGNADHVVAVVFEGGRWFYDSNQALVEFEPVESDLLIASVDFTADTVTGLAGETGRHGGIEFGYASGDLVFVANRWNGVANRGEFGIDGGTLVRNQAPAPDDPPAPGSITLGRLNKGVVARDGATGTGYLLYTQTPAATRFEGLHPGNAAHVVSVVFEGDRWFYDTNSELVAFTPEPGDILLAEQNFTNDTVLSLQGRQGTHQGITLGYASGDLNFYTNLWDNRENPGEFGIRGGTFVPHGGAL